MSIKRYDFGTRYSGNTGVPDIIEKVGGRYVLHTDYAAQVALTEALKLGGVSIDGTMMSCIATPPARDWTKIQAHIEEYVDGYEMIGEDDQGLDG